MGEGSILENSDAIPFHIIFTDLDGTLLNHDTYAWQAAEPALELCNALKIPVILVSSKTRAEMEAIRREMSISDPFIVENGGGIFFSVKDFEPPPINSAPVNGKEGLRELAIGLPYARLTKELQGIRKEFGLNLKGFSDMSIDEIIQVTGLDPKSAGLAANREFDEPFLISGDPLQSEKIIITAAKQRGLSVTRGGRFFHLQGDNDKGQAMEMVISWYEKQHGKVTSIALGDSPNDFPMLEIADYPVLVRSKCDFPLLRESIPHLIVSRDIGPTGWNAAVLEILETRTAF